MIKTKPSNSDYRRGWDSIYGEQDQFDPELREKATPIVDGYITTFTGRALYFDNPTPDMICIEDIAHALSQQCRFAGHTQRFLSVAEHSVLVASLSAPYHLEGLLHDAAEAYMVDMPTPIKRLIKDYSEFEAKIMKAIATRFGIRLPLPSGVKEADTAQLLIEAQCLLADHSWSSQFSSPIKGLEPFCLSSLEAEKMFLTNFYWYME